MRPSGRGIGLALKRRLMSINTVVSHHPLSVGTPSLLCFVPFAAHQSKSSHLNNCLVHNHCGDEHRQADWQQHVDCCSPSMCKVVFEGETVVKDSMFFGLSQESIVLRATAHVNMRLSVGR